MDIVPPGQCSTIYMTTNKYRAKSVVVARGMASSILSRWPTVRVASTSPKTRFSKACACGVTWIHKTTGIPDVFVAVAGLESGENVPCCYFIDTLMHWAVANSKPAKVEFT